VLDSIIVQCLSSGSGDATFRHSFIHSFFHKKTFPVSRATFPEFSIGHPSSIKPISRFNGLTEIPVYSTFQQFNFSTEKPYLCINWHYFRYNPIGVEKIDEVYET